MDGDTPQPALLLFDIDGTLLLTGRAGLRAMVGAFEALFGVPDGFEGVSMGGRTDSWLLSDALSRWGLPDTPDNHARFRAAYLSRLAEEILQPGTGVKGVMPGVRALLDAAAAHPQLHLALLTGNYHEAAGIKLRYFNLWNYFAFGAYADDSADRNRLVPIARERASAHGIPGAAAARVVVIGDTPHDVACAAAAGARSVGVATEATRARNSNGPARMSHWTISPIRRGSWDCWCPDLPVHSSQERFADAFTGRARRVVAEAPGSRTQPAPQGGSSRF